MRGSRIGLYIGAAIMHGYLKHDGVMRRMSLFR